MKVFKFGGASVNSADAVRNMAHIVCQNIESDPLCVVVSAMGKTTNLLEHLVPGTAGDHAPLRQQLEAYHLNIAHHLLPNDTQLTEKLRTLLRQLDATLNTLPPTPQSYNFNYDQVVSYGELLSTTIIAHYLNQLGTSTLWADARQLLRTDSHHREGRIDWDITSQQCRQLRSTAQSCRVILTQGFIAANAHGHTTTLGREGSDYSAAILAATLGAESVTIWKDVAGFLNADPKFFPDTIKIAHLPYNEAIELAYYGASVIHPKTVKPLQNASIPLYIRSFLTPDTEGSSIGNYRDIDPKTPLYIFRNNQILLSILPRDYSFIAEDNLQTIFGLLNEIGVRVNLMQNSALSFSLCIDNNPQLVPRLVERLNALFHVRYNEHLQLITVRYYAAATIDHIVAGRPILLEQRSRLTAQIIVPETGQPQC